MKNKIINHSVVILCFCLCVVFAKGSNNLKIFRNVNGSLGEVSSQVETPSGANFTLICTIENIKQIKHFNEYGTWIIPPKKLSKLNYLRKSSNLVLSNVNVNDEGFYICTNVKLKMFKSLHLLVKKKPNEILEPDYLKTVRQKRDVIYGNDDYNITRPQEWEELQKAFEEMAKKETKENERNYLNNRNNYGINGISVSNNTYGDCEYFCIK